MSDILEQIAQKIIEQQENIIGPVAVEQARQVSGLAIDWPEHAVTIEGDGRAAIDKLMKQYKELFGQIAEQVSKEAVANLTAQLAPDQVPDSLR